MSLIIETDRGLGPEAHEGELSTSAMLRVSGSKWMVWESEALIVPSGSKKIFPARVSGIVPEAALEGEEAQVAWRLKGAVLLQYSVFNLRLVLVLCAVDGSSGIAFLTT